MAAAGPAAASAGRHLELLARFAAPNLSGVSGPFSTTPGIFGGGGGGGVLTVAEALLRAGQLPYSAVELLNGANGLAGPALTSTLQGRVSTLHDGSGPAALSLFRGGPMWNPQDVAGRVPPPTWSASLVHPLTTGVQPTADQTCIHHPYAGKYSTHIHVYMHSIRKVSKCNTYTFQHILNCIVACC